MLNIEVGAECQEPQASRVAQWWRILLPLQKTQEIKVWSLGWEAPLGEGNVNPLQYSCLRNPMDRGVWRATVHKVQSVRHDWARVSVYLSICLSNMRTTSWPPFWQRQPLHSAILGRGDSASESRWLLPGAEWWACCPPATRDSQHAAQQGWLLHTCPSLFFQEIRRCHHTSVLWASTHSSQGFLFPSQCNRKYHFLASFLFGSKQR